MPTCAISTGASSGLLAPLIACIIWLGVYPAPVLRRTEPAAARFVHLVEHGYESAHPAPPRTPIIQPPKGAGSLVVLLSASRPGCPAGRAPTWNLAMTGELLGALGPDLLLAGGAVVLLLVAVARPESDRHLRRVVWASLGLVALTLAAVVAYASGGAMATEGPIAVDTFRWAVDIIVLIGTGCTIALSMDSNPLDGILAAESHVLVALCRRPVCSCSPVRAISCSSFWGSS